MNKNNLSIVACGLLLSANSLFAESSIKTAIAAGQASGDVSVYHENKNNKGTTADSGFTAGTVGLSYETGSFNGFSAKTSFRAGHEFAEKEDGDYKGAFVNNSIINEAYIKYANESYALTTGRQEIDLEWIGDFNEAIIGEVTALENTIITAGFASRQSVAGADEIGEFNRFKDANNSDKIIDGIYLLDVKYSGIEGIELNPYFYSITDVSDFYGFKATYSNDMFGILGHYAGSSEDVTGIKDGNIYKLELSATLGLVNLAAGFIGADKDGAIGSMGTFGDNIKPFDDAGQVYATDAKTSYASISTEIEGISLGAVYGSTKYLNGTTKEKEKTLNLTAAYEIAENTSLELLYVDIDAQDPTTDWNKVAATVTYSF